MMTMYDANVDGFVFLEYVWGRLGVCVLASSLLSRKLFNCFAQSARPGSCRPSDDRTNPNEQENKRQTNKHTNNKTTTRQHKTNEERNEQINNERTTPESLKNGPRSRKSRPDLGRNGPKTVQKRTQESKNEVGADPGGFMLRAFVFFAILARFWRPFSSRNRKKNDSNIVFFLSAFGFEDGGKKGTKTSRNRSQDGPKSIPEESAKKKRGKYENEQQSYVLARFWVPAGVENRRGNRKKGVENDSKSKGNFEADFQGIFVDFGSILESRMDRKSKKKDQKQDRF